MKAFGGFCTFNPKPNKGVVWGRWCWDVFNDLNRGGSFEGNDVLFDEFEVEGNNKDEIGKDTEDLSFGVIGSGDDSGDEE